MSCTTIEKLKDVFENTPWYIKVLRKIKKFFITGIDDGVWDTIRSEESKKEFTNLLAAIRARRNKN